MKGKLWIPFLRFYRYTRIMPKIITSQKCRVFHLRWNNVPRGTNTVYCDTPNFNYGVRNVKIFVRIDDVLSTIYCSVNKVRKVVWTRDVEGILHPRTDRFVCLISEHAYSKRWAILSYNAAFLNLFFIYVRPLIAALRTLKFRFWIYVYTTVLPSVLLRYTNYSVTH